MTPLLALLVDPFLFPATIQHAEAGEILEHLRPELAAWLRHRQIKPLRCLRPVLGDREAVVVSIYAEMKPGQAVEYRLRWS